MATIVCTTTFLDGRDRFEQGETRVVDDDRAERFIAAGWAAAPGQTPLVAGDGAAATLDIQNVVHRTEVIHA